MVVERGANVTPAEARHARGRGEERPAALAGVLRVQRDLGQHVPGHQHRQRRAGAGLGGHAAPRAGGGAAGRLVAARAGRRCRAGAALRAALGYGVAQFGVNLPLLYWGEKTVPSGLSAVIYATIPLTSALMTRALGLERLTPRQAGRAPSWRSAASPCSSRRASAATSRRVGLAAIFIGGDGASAAAPSCSSAGRARIPFGANAVGCAIGAVDRRGVSFALRRAPRAPDDVRAAWPLLYLTSPARWAPTCSCPGCVNHWTRHAHRPTSRCSCR